MNSLLNLSGCGELEIVRERTVELSPLVSILEECYIHELDKARRDKDYTPSQLKTRRAENVNMLVRNQWKKQQKSNPWEIVDGRYAHMQDKATGLYLEVHPANPLTGKVAKPAKTERSKARYTQKGCRKAGEIGLWLYSESEWLVPNLSDVSLQALWRWEENQMLVTVYKPLDAGKGSFCIEIPLMGDKEQQRTLKFETVSENDNVLQDLLVQDDDETIVNSTDDKLLE